MGHSSQGFFPSNTGFIMIELGISMLYFTKNLIILSFFMSLFNEPTVVFAIAHSKNYIFFLSVSLTRKHSQTNYQILFHSCRHDDQQTILIATKNMNSIGKALIATSMKNCNTFTSRWLIRDCTLNNFRTIIFVINPKL